MRYHHIIDISIIEYLSFIYKFFLGQSQIDLGALSLAACLVALISPP